MYQRIFVSVFSGLVQRGGVPGPHKDGWGITFYEGLCCRTFKDQLLSIDSPIARLVQDYPIKSCTVVSHIRQANRSRVALENTHQFTRELWGRHWTFAHNSQLRGYRTLKTGNFHPVGQTDSVQAFCWLLARLAERYPQTPCHWPSVFRYIADLADSLRQKKSDFQYAAVRRLLCYGLLFKQPVLDNLARALRQSHFA